MKKTMSLLVVLAMLVALVPAVIAAEAGIPQAVAQGTAAADVDSKFTVPFEATEGGTLTITVGDGTAAWVSDVYSFVNWSASTAVSGSAEQTYTVDVEPGSYYVRFYGPLGADDLSTAISGIPYSISFTASGVPVGPTLEEFQVATDVFTKEGTYDVAVAGDVAEVTLYTFAPEATGTYTVELLSGNAEISLWSTASYSKIADAVGGVLSLTASAIGQEWFVAFDGEAGAAQIKITKTGEAPTDPSYETVTYENKQTPVLFDDMAYTIDDFVNYTDDVVDTAVLGADGYYHLNSADGPVLYVDFFGVEPSLGSAWGYGNVSYAVYEGGELASVINYQDALGEYLMAENNEGFYSFANNYHPLTADLIEMIQNIGENNNWYGENGLVANTEDAWLFACVTMVSNEEDLDDTTTPGGNTGSGNTGSGNTGSGNTSNSGSADNTGKVETPDTGDFGVIAAVVALAASTVCGTAVVAKKKEN